VTLTYAGRLDRPAVSGAASLVHELVARPEVESGWTQESSCAGMTVGGLARHLVTQTSLVVGLLGAEQTSTDAPMATLLDHYAHPAWLEGIDGESHRLLRERSDAQATEGHHVALSLHADAVAALPGVLADPPETVLVPWQARRMATDDFVVTRLVEMVVHADDLAASVDVEVPAFDDAVLEPVLGLLAALAVVRHGQDAVVRTLSRPQRAPASISAF
jgi:hypothetical protein